MFGLERDKPRKRFEFDLEVELKKNSREKARVLGRIDAQTAALKSALVSGVNEECFDRYGLLIQAYAALKKVVERVVRN